MQYYNHDKSIELDVRGLAIRERHGYTEAVCECCGQWCRIGKDYKGKKVVIKQMMHIPRCDNLETFDQRFPNDN